MRDDENFELHILKKLRGFEGFSQVWDSGTIEGTNLSFLIMEKLGYNLRDLLRRVSRNRFSLKTVV